MVKIRIIQCGEKYKLQEKTNFFSDWSDLGIIYNLARHEITYYDTYEEAEENAQRIFNLKNGKVVKVYKGKN